MNEIDNKKYVMVERNELQEILESAIKNIVGKEETEKESEIKQIGGYVSQREAMKLLNRKNTWFHTKRKSRELIGKKSANQWWYKRSELENYLKKGLEITD